MLAPFGSVEKGFPTTSNGKVLRSCASRGRIRDADKRRGADRMLAGFLSGATRMAGRPPVPTP